MIKHFILIVSMILLPLCSKAQGTYIESNRGIEVWSFYKGGTIVQKIPADSIDSVAVVSKRFAKFYNSQKEQLYTRTITQIDSICLQRYADSDSLAFADAQWNWKDLGRGAKLGSAIFSIFGTKECVSIIKYPVDSFETQFINSPYPDQGTVPTIAKRYDAFAAINASFFDMTSYYPHTYFYVNHELAYSLTSTDLTRSNGFIAYKDTHGKEMEMGYLDESKMSTYWNTYNTFLQSGPLLMLNKHIQPCISNDFNNTRYPRTVMGYDKKGYYYFMVVDGRFPSYGANGASARELAYMSRYAGMDYAINLDGGGSSTLWSQQYGVINYPCDNNKFDHAGLRVVPSIIIMK